MAPIIDNDTEISWINENQSITEEHNRTGDVNFNVFDPIAANVTCIELFSM